MLTCRPELDSRVGIPVGGMRLPAVDDDHGIPGLRRRFIGPSIQPPLMQRNEDERRHDERRRHMTKELKV